MNAIVAMREKTIIFTDHDGHVVDRVLFENLILEPDPGKNQLPILEPRQNSNRPVRVWDLEVIPL